LVENAIARIDAPTTTAAMLRTRRRVRITAYPPVVLKPAC
jgi:hypothetical protein